MVGFFELLILVGILGALAFYEVKPIFWTAVTAGVLVIYSFFSSWNLLSLLLISVLFAAVALFANVAFFRKILFSKHLLHYFQHQLPPLSDTEKEALEAGDVWWEGELFCGNPHWQTLFDLGQPKLSAEEQSFIDNEVETLCYMLNDWKIIREDHDLSPETWTYLKENGFFGLIIPKQYGGHEFSALANSTVVNKIATRSLSAAVNTMVPNTLGPAELLIHYGTEEQKNHYLPRLAKGIDVPCFALTATDAGSDAGAIPDTGIVCKGRHEGKEVLGLRLDWDKRYITLAPIATVLGLAFKMYDPDHLLSKKEDLGITLCLVPTDHPGVEIGKRHLPKHMAFMNGPTRGKDVFIPLEWIIGGPKMAGQGWRMLMECLSDGRGISLPALATGSTKLVCRTTGAYAWLRRQFKLPIGRFEGVQEALARIAGFTYICEATRLLTTQGIDRGMKPSIITAITKYHLTELARIACNDGFDVHAGRAIQLGPRNYIGHIHDGIPVAITVEGANILTRNLIIFGQGAVRCHPFILQEIEAAQSSDINKFDKVLFSHVGYALSNFMRTLTYGITGARWVRVPKHKHLKRYMQSLTRMSSALSLIADMAMLVLGGSLKRRERLSARLGDVLSYLYLASAVMKYYVDQGKPTEDMAFVDWCLQYCLYHIQTAFEAFFANFPSRVLATILRKVVFPWGRSFKMPADKLGEDLSLAIMKPSKLRDRITEHLFIDEKNGGPVHRLEKALQASFAAQELEGKKKLTDKEKQQLEEAEKLRFDAMLVDEFEKI